MPSEYVKVSSADEILEYKTFTDDEELPPNPADLHRGKPRWLPVETVGASFDPVSQVQSGPTMQVEALRVVRLFVVRAKNSDEIEAMREAKKLLIEAEYLRRRYEITGLVTVDGVEREWHFDQAGVNEVGHVLQLMSEGIIPEEQDFKPVGIPMVPVTRDGYKALALAFAIRARVVFGHMQYVKEVLRAIESPADIHAFNPLAGWG